MYYIREKTYNLMIASALVIMWILLLINVIIDRDVTVKKMSILYPFIVAIVVILIVILARSYSLRFAVIQGVAAFLLAGNPLVIIHEGVTLYLISMFFILLCLTPMMMTYLSIYGFFEDCEIEIIDIIDLDKKNYKLLKSSLGTEVEYIITEFYDNGYTLEDNEIEKVRMIMEYSRGLIVKKGSSSTHNRVNRRVKMVMKQAASRITEEEDDFLIAENKMIKSHNREIFNELDEVLEKLN